MEIDVTKLLKVISNYVGTKPIGKYVVFQAEGPDLKVLTTDEESMMQLSMYVGPNLEQGTYVIEQPKLRELTSHMRRNSKAILTDSELKVGKYSEKVSKIDKLALDLNRVSGDRFKLNFKAIELAFDLFGGFSRPITGVYNVVLSRDAMRIYDIGAKLEMKTGELLDYDYVLSFRYRPFAHILNALSVITPYETWMTISDNGNKYYALIEAQADVYSVQFILDLKVDMPTSSTQEYFGHVDLSALYNLDQNTKCLFRMNGNLEVYTIDGKQITSAPILKSLGLPLTWTTGLYKFKFLDLSNVDLYISAGALVLNSGPVSIELV